MFGNLVIFFFFFLLKFIGNESSFVSKFVKILYMK